MSDQKCAEWPHLFLRRIFSSWHGWWCSLCCETFKVARYAVDADQDMFANLRRRWRWSFSLCFTIFALSFPLLAFGGMDVCFAVVADRGDEAVGALVYHSDMHTPDGCVPTCTPMRGCLPGYHVIFVALWSIIRSVYISARVTIPCRLGERR